MKTTLLSFAIALFAIVPFTGIAHAQMMYGYGYNGYGGMMGGYGYESAASSSAATSTSDVAGQTLWNQLSAKQISCNQLTNSDFASLGDYFMGAMMGSAHEAADQQMTYALGAQGDEQMHIAMGERLSGCNPSAAYPQGGENFFPSMMGGWGMMGYGYPGGGISYGFGYSPFGWLLEIGWWILVAVGVVFLVRWLMHRRHGHGSLDILKERYAKGEIEKAEFESKKKDLR